MASYFAIVFSNLERDSAAWSRAPPEPMAAVVAEYRRTAQSVAGQYGGRCERFAGDGPLLLFDSADSAVHFGLKLIAIWRERRQVLAAGAMPEMRLRLGCHFGDCAELPGGARVGRAIGVARRVADAAVPDTLTVTQTVMELIDLSLYAYEEAGVHVLPGDRLPQRRLYRVRAVDWAALAARPDAELTAEDWFLRAVAMIGTAQENSDDEAECYERALRLRPHYPQAHHNLAVLLRGRGEIEAAAAHYRTALDLAPRYAEAHYNFAILLEQERDMAGAAEHYREAIRWNPDYTDAHHRYANLLAARGEDREADEHYREALRLRPGAAEAHGNYASLLERKGDPAGAEAHYREALRLRPDYPEAHYNYAMFLKARGEADAAEQHYRAALRAAPDYAEAHSNLAVLLLGKGDLAGAEEHYATALRLRPQDPETNYNFALVAQARGDRETADRHFRIANDLAPEAAELRTPPPAPE